MFKVPEKYRVQHGQLGSDAAIGNNGMFVVPLPAKLRKATGQKAITIIASDGLSWEHVSASFPNKTPSWDVMCFVKDLFWSEAATVIQYHPAKEDYVNKHPYCLHLWRPEGVEIPKPPTMLVG